jgi:hypothetical protein
MAKILSNKVYRMIKLQKIKNQKLMIMKSAILPTENKVLLETTLVVSVISILLVLFNQFNDTTMALAEQTDTVNASKTVNVSKDILWEIVSDPDRNPDYWPITIIENTNKSNNTLERKAIVPAPPFMDNKAHQIITIDPSRFIVIENQTQGAVTGVKTISLIQRGYNTNLTQINVVWNLDLSKIPVIGQGFAKNGISNSVVSALDKIPNTATKQ